MNDAALGSLLDDVAAGLVLPDDAAAKLRRLPFADLGFARIDHHRQLRQGLPEAIYAPGKTIQHCVEIVGELLGGSEAPVLLSRANADQVAAVVAAHPGSTVVGDSVVWRSAPPTGRSVLVATAGTADLAVADECATVLATYGVHPERLNDVGVAGLHRLLASLDVVQSAEAIVVVAGMEGALASVVGGLTAVPVIAVPTSTGYGSSFEGVTALLAMLSSCASGVAVVGIDNGFGAACCAIRSLGLHRCSDAGASADGPAS